MYGFLITLLVVGGLMVFAVITAMRVRDSWPGPPLPQEPRGQICYGTDGRRPRLRVIAYTDHGGGCLAHIGAIDEKGRLSLWGGSLSVHETEELIRRWRQVHEGYRRATASIADREQS